MKILYFAWLRERIGVAEEEVSPPPGIVTLADLTGFLAARSPKHAAAFADMKAIRGAIDQQAVLPGTALGNAREIAFFPPFTGG